MQIVGPTMADPLHVMVGARCGDWGVCLYLSVGDAVRLHSELGRVLAEHAERG